MRRSTQRSGVRRRRTAGTSDSAGPNNDSGSVSAGQPDEPVSADGFHDAPKATVPWLFERAGNPPHREYVEHVVNHDNAYDDLRSRPRRPGDIPLSDLPLPRGAIRRPNPRTYSDWKTGKSVPNTDHFGAGVPLLIDFLLKKAADNGHKDLPNKHNWVQHLKTHQPRQRPARPRSGGQTRELLTEWCAAEARRHQAALTRLPYLAGHPDPAAGDNPAHLRIGSRSPASPESPPADVADGQLDIGWLPTRLFEHILSAAYDTDGLAGDYPGGDAIPYLDAFRSHRQLVVHGDAGSGKTWLLHQHAIAVAHTAIAALQAARTPVDQVALPILVRADTTGAAHTPGRTLAETAIDALIASGSRIDNEMLRRALVRHCSTGAVVYLIDSLDETTADQHATLAELLTPPDNTNAGTHYIATSRLAGYTHVFDPAHATHAELLPLTHPESYISSWQLPEDREYDLLERIKGDTAIAQMARIPLLLAFLCHLAKDTTEPLPPSRAELYQRITRRFLTAEHRPHRPKHNAAQPDPFSLDPNTRADELLDILKPIAYAIATDPAGWLDSVAHQQLLSHLRTIERPERLSPAATLTVLATDTGILTPTGPTTHGRTPTYRFIHRTLAEYLIAAHLQTHPDIVDGCLDEHLHLDPDWRQVWILWAGLTPQVGLPKLISRSEDPLHTGLLTGAQAVSELDPQHRTTVSDDVDALVARCSALLAAPNAHDIVRLTAFEALTFVGGQAVVDAFHEQLRTASDDLVRGMVRALGKCRDVEAFGFLVGLAIGDHGDRDIREMATQTAIDLGGAWAIASFANVLLNPQVFGDDVGPTELQTAREAAAAALSRSDDPDAMSVLAHVLTDPDTDPKLRRETAERLGRSHDPSTFEALSALALDTTQNVRLRAAAIRGLSAARAPAAITALSQVLSGPDIDLNLRGASAEGLSDILAETSYRLNEAAQAASADPAAITTATDAAIAALAHVLTGTDTPLELRRHAAKALGRALSPGFDGGPHEGNSAAITALGRVLTNGDAEPDLRQYAAERLGFARDPAAITLLGQVLHDPQASIELRCDAAKALGYSKDQESIRLTVAVLTDSDIVTDLRRHAAEALGQALSPGFRPAPHVRDHAAITALGQIVTDTGADHDLRVEAAEALGSARDPAAGSPLATVTTDKGADLELRRAAAKALGRTENRDDDATAALQQVLFDTETDTRLRCEVARSLRWPPETMLIRAATKGVIAPLCQMLTDTSTDTDVRCEAARLLAYADEAAAIQTVVTVLTDTDADADLRHAAAEALAVSQDPAATEGLCQVLTDPDTDLHDAAARDRALPQHPMYAWWDAISGTYADLRCTAAASLGHSRDLAAIPALAHVLADSRVDRRLREAVMEALGSFRDIAANNALRELLTDNTVDGELRSKAAEYLRSADEPAAMDALFALLADGDTHSHIEFTAMQSFYFIDRETVARCLIEHPLTEAHYVLMDSIFRLRDWACPRELRQPLLTALITATRIADVGRPPFFDDAVTRNEPVATSQTSSDTTQVDPATTAAPENADPAAPVETPDIAAELEYDSLTLAKLRARLQSLSGDELEALLAYETATKARPPFETLLSNRITRMSQTNDHA